MFATLKLLLSLLLIAQIIILECAEPFRLSRGCNFTLSKDVPDQSPVYLYAADKSKPYRLLKPSGMTTVLPTGSRLMLACTGSASNVIQSENVSRLELVCGAGDVFRTTQNSERQLRNMSCSSLTGSTLRATSIKCGANGKGFLQEVGFEYAPNFFAHLFDVCYDNHTEHTFYTYNVLNGRAANFSIVQSVRRAFNAAGMQYSSSAANTIYTINNQLARFESYFGPDQPYITSKDFLARGHLTPDADMIFGYEQLATYYYTNAAPEFQAVNAGNWLRVENLARLLAGQLNDDLQIYNGHLGVLQLPHHRIVNSSMPIYLDDAKRIYAPEYFFKVIRHVKTNSAIVLITLNNQYATKVNVFCTDVCEIAGFGNINFSDFSRGYTFCCKLDEFLEHYEDLPGDLKATELLTSPY